MHLIKYNLWQTLNSYKVWQLGDILRESFKQKIKSKNIALIVMSS
jgi:hypothetical protein